MARRRRKGKPGKWVSRLLTALLAVPALYLVAALVGSLVPVNRSWVEPTQGTTIYIADNGIHADIIMPARAGGLDWTPIVPKADFAAPDPAAQWVAFGAGEERVYLNTPRWRDIRPATIWSALAGGRRVMHVEWVADPRTKERFDKAYLLPMSMSADAFAKFVAEEASKWEKIVADAGVKMD